MRTRITLVVLSDTLSIDEISSTLGLEPDWATERGTPVTGSSGNLRKYTAVAFESDAPDASPSTNVDSLLGRLSGAKNEIRALAGASALPPESRGVPVRITLHVESDRGMFGFDLSAQQLAEIADLGAHLAVEIAVDKDIFQD